MSDRQKKRRPGYLKRYAEHAGIAISSASEVLRRIGIDYSQSFDFAEADRRREAARHADRAFGVQPVYVDPSLENDPPDPANTDPAFAQSQARREMFRAKLAELDFMDRCAELIYADDVDKEWFRNSRMLRDKFQALPARMKADLAAETDPNRVEDLLASAIEQILDEMANLAELGRSDEAA